MKLAAHAFHLLDIAVYLHARQPPDASQTACEPVC
jgi:hypothetical protein